MTRASQLRGWMLRRIVFALPLVTAVTAVTFALIHLAPGDPIVMLAGDGGSPAYYAEMRAKYGLDRSLPEQFFRYTRAILSGDFGYSFMYQAPVARVLLDHAPASAILAVTAIALAAAAGFAAGVLCSLLRSRLVDRLVRGVSSVCYAAPVFWTGQMLILFVAVKLGWLPAGGMTTARDSLTGVAYAWDVARHLVLPAVALALPFAAIIARVSRAAMLETLHEPFVQAVYARGLSHRRAVLSHAVPHALVPVVALIGDHAAGLIAGAAVTEALFGWPGIGYLVLHASLHRDYPLVTTAFIAISAGVVLFNTVTDVICAWLDPRIQLS